MMQQQNNQIPYQKGAIQNANIIIQKKQPMKTKKKVQNAQLDIFVAQFTETYKTKEDLLKLEYQLGVDEAGRGPVLGPMVYSVLWWPKKFKEKFVELGFEDSKTLKQQQREMLFQLIKKYNNTLFFFEVQVLSAQTLSKKQQKYDAVNLNTISHNAAIKLIRSALSQGFKITDIYVDTVGDPDRYRQYILSRIPEYTHIVQNVTVQPKADQDHKVVSASSICAKVTRDKIVSEWKFAENLDFGNGYGSGYTSDARVVDWLANNKHRVFGFPSFVRFSWNTITKLLQNFCVLRIKQQKSQQRNKNLNGLKRAQIDLFDLVK